MCVHLCVAPAAPPLQVNPQIEADTAQLDALKEHKSGTRAVIAKQTLAAREKGFAAATGAMSALSGAVQRALMPWRRAT